jgi:outer membrane protein assembly factor BamB
VPIGFTVPPYAAAPPPSPRRLQAELAWSVPLPAPLAADPSADATQVYVALRTGRIVALDHRHGEIRWVTEIPTARRPATGEDRVFIAPEFGGLVAVAASTGAPLWEAPDAGSIAAPLLWKGGWLVAGSEAAEIVALRASDGHEIWRRSLGSVMRRSPGIVGDRLYAPLEDGRIAALDLLSGLPIWERQLRSAPGQILALDDRLFAGAADGFFYCLSARDGRVLWRWRIGAEIAGAPVADDERVYVAALDNALRGLDRRSGIQRWRRPLPVRPSGGPVATGGLLIVGSLGRGLLAYESRTGAPAGELPAPTGLMVAPRGVPVRGFLDPFLVIVTGAETGEWQLHGVGPARYPLVPLEQMLGPMLELAPVPPMTPGLPPTSSLPYRRALSRGMLSRGGNGWRSSAQRSRSPSWQRVLHRLHLLRDGRGQPAHAFDYAPGRRGREGQAQHVATAAVNEEGGAADVDDTIGLGARQQPVGIELRRQRRPQEEAAARHRPGQGAAERVLEGAHHDVALLAIVRAQARCQTGQHAAATALVHQALIEHAGAEVGGLLGQLELRGNGCRRCQPSDTESWSQRLGEAAQIDYPAVPVVRLDGADRPGGRRLIEVELAVGIVLDDEQVVAGGPLEQGGPLAAADEQTGRILEVGYHIEQAHAPSG